MGNIIGGILGGILGKKAGKKAGAEIDASSAEAIAPLGQFTDVGGQANEAIAGALGLGGRAGQESAFNNFLSSTGFQSRLRAGSEAITGNQAAAGLLNSGSTLKRLTRFGQELSQGEFSNFLGNLGGLAGRGAATASTGAQLGVQSGQAAAEARLGGRNALASGLGQAAEGLFSFAGI